MDKDHRGRGRFNYSRYLRFVNNQMMLKLVFALMLVVFITAGCTGEQAEPTATPTLLPPPSTPIPPTATLLPPTATLVPSTAAPPTETPKPTETPVPSPEPTATEVPITVIKDIPYIPDGHRRQVLDIYLPPEGEEPFPVLFLIHTTLGEEYGGDKSDFQYTAEHFASNGYGVISVNYRIAPYYEYPARIEDIVCALAWVHANGDDYDLDPSFVVATGNSLGATYAALVGTTDDFSQYLIECPNPLPESASVTGVIGLYGGYDLTMETRYEPHQMHNALEDSLGVSLAEDPDRWLQASPINYIDGSEPPFLLIHGEDATASPGKSEISVGESKGFAKMLEEADVPVKLVLIPGVETDFLGHIPQWKAENFDRDARDAAYKVMEDFLEKLKEGS